MHHLLSNLKLQKLNVLEYSGDSWLKYFVTSLIYEENVVYHEVLSEMIKSPLNFHREFFLQLELLSFPITI